MASMQNRWSVQKQAFVYQPADCCDCVLVARCLVGSPLTRVISLRQHSLLLISSTLEKNDSALNCMMIAAAD